MRTFFGFPNPVNEVSARLVAAGVVILCALILVLDQPWLLLPLAYGFLARVLTGPNLSPLGLVVTRLVTPRLPVAPKLVAGPPKRFAQGIGATLSTVALTVHFGFGAAGLADLLVAMILVAATLEAALGFCLGCTMFGLLMQAGVIPATVCSDCCDIAARQANGARTMAPEDAEARRRLSCLQDQPGTLSTEQPPAVPPTAAGENLADRRAVRRVG